MATILPNPLEFVTLYDVTRDLDRYHPRWQNELLRIGREHATAHTTTGEGDPTSLMKPDDKPITALRVHPREVEREAPWFVDFCAGAVALAREVFGKNYEGAGRDDTDSMFDFNVSYPPDENEPIVDGEPHVDSQPGAGLLCVAADPVTGYSRTRFSRLTQQAGGDLDDAVELRLRPGQMAFFNGQERPHQAVGLPYQPGIMAVRMTVATNFWTIGGKDPDQRTKHHALLYQ